MALLDPVFIKATTIEDSWFQLIYKLIEQGKDFIINEGSYQGEKRLEFDFVTCHITHPWILPLLPQLPAHYNIPNPVSDDYLNSYLPYLMTAEVKEGESYTYGQRISGCDIGEQGALQHHNKLNPEIYKTESFWKDSKIIGAFTDKRHLFCLNQIELVIWTYKNKGHRNNQMVLQIAQPDDMLLLDPPCLRHIFVRVQDGKLHFHPYFRSNDIFSGYPANLAGIELLKQYMASEIGVENGEIVYTCSGAHIYSYVWELAELLRGKTINEFREKK